MDYRYRTELTRKFATVLTFGNPFSETTLQIEDRIPQIPKTLSKSIYFEMERKGLNARKSQYHYQLV